ncbi:MAG: SDR family NAD(P)-dependent oxidoreductase, partial [Pseudomonadota bacterium]
MQGKRVTVVTGSTGGIGRAISDQLAAAGCHLVLVNRNEAKAQAQKAELQASHPGAGVDTVTADLMDVAQIKEASNKIVSMHPKVDLLFNNSGVLTSERVMSVQGHESNYAVNTLAAYVMTQGLRPALRSQAGGDKSMIVNTT